jgi:hypothetical protein
MNQDFLQAITACGLGTLSISIPSTSPATTYNVSGKLSLPSLTGGSSSQSAVVVTVTQNATVIYTGLSGAQGFKVEFFGNPADVISIALTSANSIDAGLNNVKGSYYLTQGV